MQSFIVVASLVSELAGGQNVLVFNVTKNTSVLKGLRFKSNSNDKTWMYVISNLFQTHHQTQTRVQSVKKFIGKKRTPAGLENNTKVLSND